MVGAEMPMTSDQVIWSEQNRLHVAYDNCAVAAGGKAFIAHPFRYQMTHTKIKNMLSDFKEVLGDGLEVVTATSTDDEISIGNQWSKDYNLLATCGSDFHGWPNQRIQIGNLRDLPDFEKAVWSYL